MQTITIDGKEFVLIPKEQLREVSKPPENIEPDKPQSVLSDFLDESVEVLSSSVDDGLATNSEKKDAIRVVDTQDIVVPAISAPPAQSKPYAYRERYLNKELLSSDIMTFSRISTTLLEGNPEDPMIKADAKKPKSQRLFYGPGNEQEG